MWNETSIHTVIGLEFDVSSLSISGSQHLHGLERVLVIGSLGVSERFYASAVDRNIAPDRAIDYVQCKLDWIV